MCEESSNKLESGSETRKSANQTRIEAKIGSQNRKSACQTQKEWKKVDIMLERKSTPGLRREKERIRPA